jgi:hypothetical protein
LGYHKNKIQYLSKKQKKGGSYAKNLKNEFPNATKTKPPIKLSKV